MRSASLRSAWAAAAVLVVVGALAGIGIAGLAGGGGDEARTVAAEIDRSALPDASAALVVPGEGGAAVLRASGMPTLQKGYVYEVWLLRDSEVTPESLFAVGADGRGAGAVPDDLAGAEAVMVTREPPGGSRAPSEQPIVTVKL